MKIHICLGICLMLICRLHAQLVPEQLGEDWGYVDKQSGKIVANGFQKTTPFFEGWSIAQKEGRWGVLNRYLQEILPFEYDQIKHLSRGIFASWQGEEVRLWRHPLSDRAWRDAGLLQGSQDLFVLQDEKGRYGVVSLKGEVIFPFEFCNPPLQLGDHILFHQQKGKKISVGLYQRNGKEIIPPNYYEIEGFAEKYFRAKEQSGTYHLYDQTGKLLYDGKGGKISWVLDDYFVLEGPNGPDEGLQTVIVRSNQAAFLLLKPEFRDGMIMGRDSEGKSRIILPMGKSVSLEAGRAIRFIDKGKMLVCRADEEDECIDGQLMDLDGNVLIPPIFTEITSWNDRWAVIRLKKSPDTYALYQWEKKPHVLLENQQRITLYDHNFVLVFHEGEKKFLNPDLGSTPLSSANLPGDPPFYLALRGYEIDRIRKNSKIFKKDSLKRINMSQIVPVETNDVKNIRDNYRKNPLPNRLIVRTPSRRPGPRIFITDIYGKVVAPLYFTSASHYENGLIFVYTKDTIDHYPKVVCGLIDFDGNVKIPLVYEKIHRVDSTFIIAEKYGLQGLISRENEVILPFKYEKILPLPTGHLIVIRFGKWGLVSPQGDILTAPQYDRINLMKPVGSGFEAILKGKVVYLDANGKK